MLRGPDARLRLIVAFLIAAMLLIVGQLVRLQLLEHSRYRAEVERLVRRQYSLPEPPWGIVTDRNGDLLVGNVPVYDIGAELKLVTDTIMAARTLAPLLGQPARELANTLTSPPHAQGWSWQPLARHVPMETAEKLRALRWPWLTITPTWERYYAEGALAAHLLGFVNQEGYGYGLLAYQLRFLRGERVQRRGYVSGSEQPMPREIAERFTIPQPGTDLRLTLDRTIQAFIEGELDRALQEYHAEGGTILVMNPRTGAILAMASRPTYEPARYADYAARGEETLFADPAISIPYEPGSVFKVVTVAAALDSGKVDLDWTYQDRGGLEYGGIIIRNWDGAAYGRQDLAGILAHSLNVGAATLSTQVLGPELFYRYVRAFGFGQKTKIELANEKDGWVHMATDWDWNDSYLATNAFGQGIAVTPLQMVTAVAAIANGGKMMQPHIIAERHYPNGRTIAIPPCLLGQPISEETARTMTELMAQAVERKITLAQVPGYRIAGKTGTAQIPTTGGYEPDDVIVSFIGFGPLPDPQLLVLVKIDRPGVPPAMRWGTQIAAPIFRRVASRLFVLLGIPPTEEIAADH